MSEAGVIQIELNGAPRAVRAGTTLAALVEELGLRPEVVAVEVNAGLVPRAERARRALAAGDTVEIVTLVGGG